MTVVNCFVQRNAAYLLSDSAWCNDRGELVGIEPKVLYGVKWPWALAITGTGVGRMDLAEAFNAANPRNAEQLVHMLPDIVVGAVRRGSARGQPVSLAVTAIAWDKKAKRPAAYICAGDRHAFGDAVEPLTVAAVNHVFPGPLTPAELLGREADFSDPASFDPVRDGLTMIDAQRRIAYAPGHGGERAYRIGSEASLTKVSRRGVMVRHIHEWPDRLGELIKPEGSPADSLSACLTIDPTDRSVQ